MGQGGLGVELGIFWAHLGQGGAGVGLGEGGVSGLSLVGVVLLAIFLSLLSPAIVLFCFRAVCTVVVFPF